MHPHRSIMHNAMATAYWGNGTHENIGLLVVPMFHITGMTSVMHAGIFMGATLVLMPRWERELAGTLDFQMASHALDQYSHHGD
jgi:fatty-acyl-CoA synthase